VESNRVSSWQATVGQLACSLCLYLVGMLAMALSIWPGALLLRGIWIYTGSYHYVWQFGLISLGLVAAFFIYGFTLIFVLGLLRVTFRLNLREGEYRIGSLGIYRWMFINGLYMLASITFMDFIQLTPFSILFFRLMGAKLGKNIQINSKKCFDLSLIEIGDNTVIGGYATIMCHSFERNRLILRKVKIDKNVVIGLNAVVMAGAQIGEGAFVTAGAILGKNKKVAPNSVYVGVPAESTAARRNRNHQ